MISTPLSTLRFLRAWLARDAPVREEEVSCPSAGGDLPATLFLRDRPRPSDPPWIVLHGITRPGRRHPELVRFARALAASPARVLVPEIRAWRELRLAPERTVPAVRAAVRYFEEEGGGSRGSEGGGSGARPGLVGFSFGAPQAVLAALEPSLRGRLAGVAGFGGYCDLERTVRFHFTGAHEWEGTRRHLRPDPYGRWVIGFNYLTEVPEHAGAEDVSRALGKLASLAGEHRIDSWDPRHDPVKEELRDTIAPSRRSLFDLFAPPADERPDPEEAERLIPRLVRAGRGVTELLDPAPLLASPPCPVRLIHGRQDHLVPYTETLRLEESFPPGSDVRATVTGLFAHSGEHPFRAGLSTLREAWIFTRALGAILGMV